jgi:hypothetical protein
MALRKARVQPGNEFAGDAARFFLRFEISIR